MFNCVFDPRVLLVRPRLSRLLTNDDVCSQMLSKKQVSKLQKAAKLAAMLANDSVPVHKHPEVLAGPRYPLSLCCLALLHASTTHTDDDPGYRYRCPNGCATGNVSVQEVVGHTGLIGHEAAPVLPVPGKVPRMPTYIHTETGPPTAHLLRDDDRRFKNKANGGVESPSATPRPDAVVV